TRSTLLCRTRSNVDSVDACAAARSLSAKPAAATMLPIAAVPILRLLMSIKATPRYSSLVVRGADLANGTFIHLHAQAGARRHASLAIVDENGSLEDLHPQHPGRGIEFRPERNVRRRRYHVQPGRDGEPAFKHGATIRGDGGRLGDCRDLACAGDSPRFHDLY